MNIQATNGNNQSEIINNLADSATGGTIPNADATKVNDTVTSLFQQFNEGVDSTINSLKDAWQGTLTTVTSFTTATAQTIGAATDTAYNKTVETLAPVTNFISTSTDTAVNTVSGWKDAAGNQLSALVAEDSVLGSIYNTTSEAAGQVYAATSAAIANNALPIGIVGASIGGVAFAKSSITLLQGNKKDISAKEIAKLVSGVGLVALSVTYAASDDNERSKLVITALTCALAKSIWDAVAAKSPKYLVFRLKAKELTVDNS